MASCPFQNDHDQRKLVIQFEGGKETVLNPGGCAWLRRGVLHNPVAEEERSIVLIETVTTKHTGEAETPLTKFIESHIGQGAL